METFLLAHTPIIPLLLPFWEWHDVENLSSASRRLSTSLLRDECFRHACVVVPSAPGDHARDQTIRRILWRLSVLTRYVSLSDPSHLALLHRLPHLSKLRIARSHVEHDQGVEVEDEDMDMDQPVMLERDAIRSLWSLAGVVQLDVDMQVEDLVGLFHGMARLQTLDMVFHTRTTSLSVLAPLRNLRGLRVRGEWIDDLPTIGTLTNLTEVQLTSRSIHDIATLDRLVHLERLDLSYCNVVDLSPVGNLSRLCYLKLDETLVEDLSPLARLTSLQALSVARTRVSDLTPLGECYASLQHLDLSDCTLSDVTALGQLTRLEWLWLQNTTWPSPTLAPSMTTTLATLPHLRVLNGLVNTVFTLRPEAIHTRLELSALQHMNYLEQLELSGSSISSMTTPLALPRLVKLRIEWNYTQEPEIPLAAVVHPQLRALHLIRLRLRSLRNLQYAPNLRELRLIDVFLEDLAMVRHASQLQIYEHTCSMVHNHYLEEYEQPHIRAPVMDLSPLQNLQLLTHVDVSYTGTHDVSALRFLPQLRVVDVSSTDVSDISPLVGLSQLECIRVRDTAIARFDGGTFCRTLRELALPAHVDCTAIRAAAPLLRRLLHPDRDCLWRDHTSQIGVHLLEEMADDPREGDPLCASS